MISGERVRFAREFRGLAQVELARQIGIKQPTLAQIEHDVRQPSDAVLHALALKTGFPLAFFRQGPPPEFPMGSLLFRSQAAFTSRERSRVHRHGQLVYEVVEHLLAPQLTDRPSVRLPKVVGVSVSEAVRLTRDALALAPDQPISNLTDAAERAGVLVFMLPTPIERGDAFSAWAGERGHVPFIAIGAGIPGDRVRMTVAHELGELVLHHSLRGRLDEMEREANTFAAELLMPAEAIRQEITVPVTLTQISTLKQRWGVSIQALVRRAYNLGLITRSQYSGLFAQLTSMGWRMEEPGNLRVPIERPRGLRKMVEVLYGSLPNYERLAVDTRLTVHTIRKFVEAQAEGPRAEQAKETRQPLLPDNVIALDSKRRGH